MKIKKTLIFSLAIAALLICVCVMSGCDLHFHEYLDATCQDPQECEICGKTKGEELGHDYVDATCDSPKTCTRCGKIKGNALGHEYEIRATSACEQKEICRRCDRVGRTFPTHKYSSATCTSPQTCTSCGATSGSSLGHNYTSASCTETPKCTRCGAISGSPLGHDYAAATCTSPKMCKRCDATEGSPKGHDYKSATCFEPKKCKNCGATSGSALGHKYADNKCIRCDEIDPDSLPVSLDQLFVIDSSEYSFKTSLTDTYGNKYNKAHVYSWGWNWKTAFSIHNLNREYSVFNGSMVVSNDNEGNDIVFQIYVDDVLVETFENIGRETEKIDFSINVKNASKLKFVFSWTQYYMDRSVAIVNAELTK